MLTFSALALDSDEGLELMKSAFKTVKACHILKVKQTVG